MKKNSYWPGKQEDEEDRVDNPDDDCPQPEVEEVAACVRLSDGGHHSDLQTESTNCCKSECGGERVDCRLSTHVGGKETNTETGWETRDPGNFSLSLSHPKQTNINWHFQMELNLRDKKLKKY